MELFHYVPCDKYSVCTYTCLSDTVQLKCNLTPAGRKPAVYLPLTRVQRARYVRVKPVVPATGSSCHTGVPFTGTH